MNYLNNLQQALQWYRSQGGGQQQALTRGYEQFGHGGQSGEIVPGMLWAQGMADKMGGGADKMGGGDQGSPDFFNDTPQRNAMMAYREPSMEGAGPMPARPMRPQQGRRMSMRDTSDNFLRELMGGR